MIGVTGGPYLLGKSLWLPLQLGAGVYRLSVLAIAVIGDCRYYKVAKSDIDNGQEDHLLQLFKPFPEFVRSPSHLATEEVDEVFRPKGCPPGFLLSLASPLKVM
jgi:hypothetical protein